MGLNNLFGMFYKIKIALDKNKTKQTCTSLEKIWDDPK